MKIKWKVIEYVEDFATDHEIEIPDSALDGLNDDEREKAIDEWVGEQFAKMVDYDYVICEDE